MTGFLASVRSVAEARAVLSAGVDILDVKEPARGALGAAPVRVLRDIVACARGLAPVSATVGDLVPEPALLGPAIHRTREAGADIVKVGVFAETVPMPVRALLAEHGSRGVRLVLVFFAELWRGTEDFAALRRCGVSGVMLDTRDKADGSLRDKLPEHRLAEFVRRAADAGMTSGLAGSLREQDIVPLLALGPDFLGFRGALCGREGRAAAVNAEATARVATLLRQGRTLARRPGAGGRAAAMRINTA
jgi:dihydroneopterin aldolase